MIALVAVPAVIGIAGAVHAPISEVLVVADHRARLTEEGAISVLGISVVQDNAGEVAAAAQPRGLNDVLLVDFACRDQSVLFFGEPRPEMQARIA